MKLVFFLHAAATTHLLDRLFSWIMLFFCDAVWGDSRSTISSRLGTRDDVVVRVISFVTRNSPVITTSNLLAPSFTFWGRLHHQKGLERSINFIRMLVDRGCAAKYEIWGPDDGELDFLTSRIKSSGLESAVFIKGPVNQGEFEKIAQSNAFYLQFSRDEGMAMSVVEAMQRSLVPVVTSVGAISEYCQHGHNAIVVEDPVNPVSALNNVISLLQDESKYRQLQASAHSHWSHHKLYKDDFCDAVDEVLKLA